jgi:hypothetical protein
LRYVLEPGGSRGALGQWLEKTVQGHHFDRQSCHLCDTSESSDPARKFIERGMAVERGVIKLIKFKLRTFSFCAMSNPLSRLLDLVFLGGLIEWSYNAAVGYFIWTQCKHTDLVSVLPVIWQFYTFISYAFYFCVYVAITYWFENSMITGRYLNIIYHTLMAIVVYCISGTGDRILIIYLPTLLLIPVTGFFAVGFTLEYFAKGIKDDCKRFWYPRGNRRKFE